MSFIMISQSHLEIYDSSVYPSPYYAASLKSSKFRDLDPQTISSNSSGLNSSIISELTTLKKPRLNALNYSSHC